MMSPWQTCLLCPRVQQNCAFLAEAVRLPHREEGVQALVPRVPRVPREEEEDRPRHSWRTEEEGVQREPEIRREPEMRIEPEMTREPSPCP